MIRPLQYSATGDILVLHEERNHTATVNIDTDVVFVGEPSTHWDWLLLPCGVCGKTPDGEWVSYSKWPITGGADAESGQALFLRKLRRCSDAVSNLPALPATANARRPFATVKAYVKQRVEALEGPDRFKHGSLTATQLGD